MIWARLTTRIQAFAKDVHGGLSIETVLMWPLLLWAYGAMFVFFDGFKQQNLALKATYTVSDTISREMNALNTQYIDTMHDLMNMLSRARLDTKLRVTMVKWDGVAKKNKVVWSEARGPGIVKYNTNSLQAVADRIPVMPHGEQVVLVQSWSIFEPFMWVGFGGITFENLVTTRPRYVAHICWTQGGTLTCGT
ncbi:TadE/TadG family type IV pilus assembly protein [Algirhabdus cladophorae]|uniref:TadE/TadG family type IV pilus assembly protein n=1 Tax=Algirhabdus cladophorae TaxID=3377108 RepID=UPI003B848F88